MFESLSFPVELMDLPHPAPLTVAGEIPDADRPFLKVKGRRAIVRTDTGDVLNIVSGKYPLIKHADVFNAMQEAITTLGLPIVGQPKESQAYSGAAAKVVWTLDKTFQIPDQALDGDKLETTITARNSYDYSSVVVLELGTLRQICTNGMTVGKLFAGSRKKHVPSIKVPELIKQITDVLEKVDSVAARMQKWQGIDYSRDRFSGWLDKVEMSKPARQEILDYFTSQPDRTKLGASVKANGWEAVNAITWFASHRIKPNKGGSTLVTEERFLDLAQSFTVTELEASIAATRSN